MQISIPKREQNGKNNMVRFVKLKYDKNLCESQKTKKGFHGNVPPPSHKCLEKFQKNVKNDAKSRIFSQNTSDCKAVWRSVQDEHHSLKGTRLWVKQV
ncbi:hypothetical protein AVEN_4792-1 [Araneus ventricosus]|uniref:Uncharacterized protein n=1 Tax=Araneus ventricosus TaxID=182803 RepID=A0A4Y2FJY0_ARAVE|nr:hypothetical protein AVEN_92009-1 [Araneus ventricosus]GBO08374.1 hypothetical protein AVEN_4792-1 [Araneus ventricosus]